MIRIGNLYKIGFSRITTIPAVGLIFSNRKLSEQIPDKNSINSIIDELKKDINKLESEMGRSIVIEKDDPFERRKALQPRFKPVPRKTAEIAYKEQEYKTLHLETMKYTVDEEPKQREIKIEMKQNEYGFKHTKISQNIENGEEYGFCYNYFLIHGPEDVSRLSNAMQALEFEWPEKYAKALRQDKPSMLCQQLVKVNVGSYKLAMQLLPNKQLDFQMESILSFSNHKLWKLRGPIPIEVFYWLKAQLAEIAEISANCDDHEFDEEDDGDEDEIYSDDDSDDDD